MLVGFLWLHRVSSFSLDLLTLCTEASLLKPRPEGLSSQRDAKEELDSLYALLEQPWTTSNQSGEDATRTEKKLVTFEGIGPTDEQTGVPIATRTVSIYSTSGLQTSTHCCRRRFAKAL